MSSDKRRITILADRDVDRDIVELFNDGDVTERGLGLLRTGRLLEDAGILEQVIMLLNIGGREKFGALGVIKRAIEIAAMVESFEDGRTYPVQTPLPRKVIEDEPEPEPIARKPIEKPAESDLGFTKKFGQPRPRN